MPFYAQDLIGDEREVITASREQSVSEALAAMVRNDFSQLPVVNADNCPEGLISYETILQALSNLKAPISKLRVSHAMTTKMRVWRQENDLFDVLEDLKAAYAVLIVDNSNRLVGIVTNYDATEYFRQRAEDMMLVGDAEESLKGHVRQAFTSNGEFDERAVQRAILQIEHAKGPDKGQFFKALAHYLTLSTGGNAKVASKAGEQAFEVLQGTVDIPPFDDLTFNDYIQLLFHKEKWDHYQATFGLEKSSLKTLLEGVRDTRNDLAHFRDITHQQRQQLQYCVEFFEQHPAVVQQQATQKHPLDVEEIAVPVIDLGPRESRYTLLAKYLEQLPPDRQRVRLSFEQIEEIIQHDLPPSAKTHRSWWANDSVGHTQSKLWLSAGWQVEAINLPEGRITFARIYK